MTKIENKDFNPEIHKIQYSLYGITGTLYKQGFVSSFSRLLKAQNRHSLKYGGGLRMETMIVPKEQKKATPTNQNIGLAYCFCPNTPLYVDRCSNCGKSPYTD